jgi:hypothetical protein
LFGLMFLESFMSSFIRCFVIKKIIFVFFLLLPFSKFVFSEVAVVAFDLHGVVAGSVQKGVVAAAMGRKQELGSPVVRRCSSTGTCLPAGGCDDGVVGDYNGLYSKLMEIFNIWCPVCQDVECKFGYRKGSEHVKVAIVLNDGVSIDELGSRVEVLFRCLNFLDWGSDGWEEKLPLVWDFLGDEMRLKKFDIVFSRQNMPCFRRLNRSEIYLITKTFFFLMRFEWCVQIAGVNDEGVALLRAITSCQPDNDLKVCIFTNCRRDWIPPYMELFGDDLKDVRFLSSEDCGAVKPDPKAFRALLEGYGKVDHPEEILVVDDDPRNIDGAKRAGMQAILFNRDNFGEVCVELYRLGVLTEEAFRQLTVAHCEDDMVDCATQEFVGLHLDGVPSASFGDLVDLVRTPRRVSPARSFAPLAPIPLRRTPLDVDSILLPVLGAC